MSWRGIALPKQGEGGHGRNGHGGIIRNPCNSGVHLSSRMVVYTNVVQTAQLSFKMTVANFSTMCIPVKCVIFDILIIENNASYRC